MYWAHYRSFHFCHLADLSSIYSKCSITPVLARFLRRKWEPCIPSLNSVFEFGSGAHDASTNAASWIRPTLAGDELQIS